MASNGAKKGVSLVIQDKEDLEQLKARSSSDIAIIKVELIEVREGTERG